MRKIKIRYTLTECKVMINETESITSYGVRCSKGDALLKEIPDISPNKTAVEGMIEEFNMSDLDPIQLEDVLEDKLDELI